MQPSQLSHIAHEILDDIHFFSPEEWASSKESSREDWELVGKVYQSSVVIYCILSLQSLSVLPTTSALRARYSTHRHTLHELLAKGLPSPKIKRFLIWPLVVLGVVVIHGSPAMRAFVAKQLPEMSRDLGTFVPLTAKRVLDRFWEKEETDRRWDDCWDKAYAFTTHIAVDTSQLLP